MEKWFIRMKKADFYGMSKRYGISPVIARILRNRDLINDDEITEYLHAGTAPLQDGWKMADMKKAIDILKEKIVSGKRIRVIGDYDIDGIMASYVLVQGIRQAGAPDTDYDIPERIRDGYGLNIRLIDQALQDGVDTIVTCDNGIAAADEIAYAKEHGMTVIVTDHHAIPFRTSDDSEERVYILPPADAVIDPHRVDCPYPYKKLCGAAVAFKLVICLYESMGLEMYCYKELLEKAAFATVGDVMELDGENRCIVKQGLEVLNRTDNIGLRALIRVNNLEDANLSAYHIGFVLGPCMNASGRLDTAKRALRLLLTDSEAEADQLAGDLKALNDSRKSMTENGVKQAVELIERKDLSHEKVLVVYLPDCHESIAGIIAGRIRERYCRPVFILTDGEEYVKGSGRSVDAYNMIEEMMKCPECFVHFGGHSMAAGLSIEKDRIEEFSGKMNEACTLTEADFYEKVPIDMVLPFTEITEGLVQELDILEPFGMGNEKPLFAAKNVFVSDMRIMGKNRNVLKMRMSDSTGQRIDALYFKEQSELEDVLLRLREHQSRMTVAFYPSINEFRGTRTMQIIIRHILF
jgi:single-stranded-DNA-specific exonuclease